MNTKTLWKIELYERHGKQAATLIQLIEADTMDKAISNAKNTFHARLHGFETPNAGSGAQKACPISLIRESIAFGFCGGWVTVHGNGEKTIFEMLKEAETHEFTGGQNILEAHALYVNGKRA